MSKGKLSLVSGDTAIQSVWQMLGMVRRVLFTTKSGPKSHMQWGGEGVASVCVSTQAFTIRFFEHGSFLPTGLTLQVPFKASWRWELKEHCLRLSHERYGADSPVFLCNFVTNGTTNLLCESPHLCGADSYLCTLALTDRGVDVIWLISGPNKEEKLEYHYLTE